jgi:hypothetical protein
LNYGKLNPRLGNVLIYCPLKPNLIEKICVSTGTDIGMSSNQPLHCRGRSEASQLNNIITSVATKE